MKYGMGDLVIDTGPQTVSRAGAPIALPKLSYDLLLVMMKAAPNVVTVDQLMREVWPGLVVSPETVSKRVTLLREALGDGFVNSYLKVRMRDWNEHCAVLTDWERRNTLNC